jgi:hypothetical protein
LHLFLIIVAFSFSEHSLKWDALNEKIRSRIVDSGDIGGPLDERIVRRPERSGGEDG